MKKRIIAIATAFLPMIVFAQLKTTPGATHAPAIAVTAGSTNGGPEVNIYPASLSWSSDSLQVEGRYDIQFSPRGTSTNPKHNLSFFANGISFIGADEATDVRLMDSLKSDIMPEFKLYVSSGIRTEQIKVDFKQSWPDYVFEKEYQVPSLEETKSYVEQHKHLPGVPSAAEVNQNGINLGQMDAILLQKLEEMTLQMIALNERLKKLEEENARLRGKE